MDRHLEGVPGEPGRDLLGQFDAREEHAERHRLAPATHHALAERGGSLAGHDRSAGLAGAARAGARHAPRPGPAEPARARVADPGVGAVGGERVERVARAPDDGLARVGALGVRPDERERGGRLARRCGELDVGQREIGDRPAARLVERGAPAHPRVRAVTEIGRRVGGERRTVDGATGGHEVERQRRPAGESDRHRLAARARRLHGVVPGEVEPAQGRRVPPGALVRRGATRVRRRGGGLREGKERGDRGDEGRRHEDGSGRAAPTGMYVPTRFPLRSDCPWDWPHLGGTDRSRRAEARESLPCCPVASGKYRGNARSQGSREGLAGPPGPSPSAT